MMEHFAADADDEWVMLDSTITRAHPCAARYKADGNECEELGRSRDGFITKIHALVDALGNPLKFYLTGGHHNDITKAAKLIEAIQKSLVLGDKGEMAIHSYSKSRIRTVRLSYRPDRTETNKELMMKNAIKSATWWKGSCRKGKS